MTSAAWDFPSTSTKTREVVQKCLDNGTILILSTIPPKHGQAEKAATFSDAVRKIARDMKVPLTDYHAEILQRRPDDWDGAADQFVSTKATTCRRSSRVTACTRRIRRSTPTTTRTRPSAATVSASAATSR